MMMALQQTVVARQREEVRDDPCEQQDRAQDKAGSSCDNFQTLSDGEESESETEELLDVEDLWDAMDDSDCVRTVRISKGKTSRRFYKKDADGRACLRPNRSESIQELKKVTICNRC